MKINIHNIHRKAIHVYIRLYDYVDYYVEWQKSIYIKLHTRSSHSFEFYALCASVGVLNYQSKKYNIAFSNANNYDIF